MSAIVAYVWNEWIAFKELKHFNVKINLKYCNNFNVSTTKTTGSSVEVNKISLVPFGSFGFSKYEGELGEVKGYLTKL